MIERHVTARAVEPKCHPVHSCGRDVSGISRLTLTDCDIGCSEYHF